MKHPTQKRPRRSLLRRLRRWWDRWVEERTRVEVDPSAKLPGLDERKARVWR